MDEERRIYMAGFFDGEGSVGIYKSKSSRTHRLRVAISQGDSWFARNFLEELKENYGGGISYLNRIPTSSHPRPMLQWWIHAQAASQFLKDIRPWLILKAEQVDLAVQWQDAQETYTSSDETLDYDYQVEQQLKDLKNLRVPTLVLNP